MNDLLVDRQDSANEIDEGKEEIVVEDIANRSRSKLLEGLKILSIHFPFVHSLTFIGENLTKVTFPVLAIPSYKELPPFLFFIY